MEPFYLSIDSCNINGQPGQRLLIVLNSNTCEYKLKTGGCTMCGFAPNVSKKITCEDYKKQLDLVLETTDFSQIDEVDLSTLGSFFNDNEIPLKFQEYAFSKLSELTNVRKVLTESRVEYLNEERLRHLKSLLGNKVLEIAIGFEAINDHIRNKVLKKNLKREELEYTAELFARLGIQLAAYTLIKPPTLQEEEAIEEAVNSAYYIFDLAQKYGIQARILFEPVFVAKNTPLEQMYLRKEYELLNLWSVVEVIKRTAEKGDVFVGLNDENISLDRVPYSCPNCYERIIAALNKFNSTQKTDVFDEITCSCN